jgi:hypothetical protein
MIRNWLESELLVILNRLKNNKNNGKIKMQIQLSPTKDHNQQKVDQQDMQIDLNNN